MNMDQQVKTMLAGSEPGIVYNKMAPALSNDTRFAIATSSIGWFDFEKTMETARPELLIVDANIAPTIDALINALSRLHIWQGVAVILIDPENRKSQPVLEKVGVCRGVFVKEPNWGDVAQAGYSAVMTERTKSLSSGDLIQSVQGQKVASTLTGMSTVAFVSASGGAGRTTIAENIGYELARTGAKTLLFSLDLPSPTPMHLRLRTSPNASEFFSRPKDGFNSCIQKYANMLDVILSPDNSIDYAKNGMREGDSSVYAMIHQTWNKNYGAVLLDLPNGEGPYMTQPLLAANKVVIVARPTLADLRGVFHIMTLLTTHMTEQVQIPRQNIFMVINQFSERATFSPNQMYDDLQEKAGWSPILAGTVMHNPAISLIQDAQELPIIKDNDFGNSIRSIISKVFQMAISDNRKQGKGILGGLFGGK